MNTMLNEETKTNLRFIATIVIPVTLWLSGISFLVHQVRADVDAIKEKSAESERLRESFERESIDRLARIESKLDSVARGNPRSP